MKSSHKKSHWSAIIFGVLIFAIVLYCVIILLKPLPNVQIQKQSLPSDITSSIPAKFTWPSSGEAAVGVLGYGLLQTNESQTPTPTASIAKLITALAVLKKDPLGLNQSGPEITVTQADVNDYNNFVAEDGSVVKVVVGEQLSEYQALQAMLLPSANNIADMLATWAYSSISNYVTYANTYVKSLGLDQTTISDPSGFLPATESTASNLVKLGELVLENPIIAQIVNQASANLPVVGTVKNVNFFLGDYGIIGIKTGNTDQAGGCYLAAAKYSLSNNQTMTVITAVMDTPTLQDALDDTVPLLQSIKNQIKIIQLTNGMPIEKYSTIWGQSTDVTTASSTNVAYIPGMNINFATYNKSINYPLNADSIVGSSVLTVGTTNYYLSLGNTNGLTKPSIWWRLTHPRQIFN